MSSNLVPVILCGGAAPIVVCNEAHRFLVRDQLAEIGIAARIVLEPAGWDTLKLRCAQRPGTQSIVRGARRDISANCAILRWRYVAKKRGFLANPWPQEEDPIVSGKEKVGARFAEAGLFA